MSHLAAYRVESAPPTVHYIPNFITHEEEQSILKKVYEVPKPKWTQLKNRRLQDYGGIPHKNGMIVEPIPTWLHQYIEKVSNLKLYGTNKANHVLVNEYLPGQGIMPHLDGYLFYPAIATISCGSHTMLEFVEYCNGKQIPLCKLLLERYSLVVLRNEMYDKYLHYIREVDEDEITEDCVNLIKCGEKYEDGTVLKREKRVSLTIRNVPKVAKIDVLNLLMNNKKK